MHVCIHAIRCQLKWGEMGRFSTRICIPRMGCSRSRRRRLRLGFASFGASRDGSGQSANKSKSRRALRLTTCTFAAERWGQIPRAAARIGTYCPMPKNFMLFHFDPASIADESADHSSKISISDRCLNSATCAASCFLDSSLWRYFLRKSLTSSYGTWREGCRSATSMMW